MALILTSTLLTACETPEDGSGQESAPPPRVSAKSTEPAPEVAALPTEPEVDDNPERLIGLGPNDLYDLLGMPELVRRESPAQIWQYRGATCVFDIVLYEEGEDSRVTYVEARDGHGAAAEARPCLNELLRSRLRAAPG